MQSVSSLAFSHWLGAVSTKQIKSVWDLNPESFVHTRFSLPLAVQCWQVFSVLLGGVGNWLFSFLLAFSSMVM